MLATVVVLWCVGSFLIAPLVGRAMRGARVDALPTPLAAAAKSLEVA